jgi:CRISPR-associated protein Cas1
MPALYLTEQGATLRKQGDTFVVTRDDQTMQTIRIVGLDPFLGFLHVVEYSRPSLALDLIEEFRAIIVDSIVLRAINTRAMNAGDFRRSEEAPSTSSEPALSLSKGQAPGAVLLTQDGIKKFIKFFEERMETKIAHPLTKQQATYRRCLELQVRQLARVLRGDTPTYKPFIVK